MSTWESDAPPPKFHVSFLAYCQAIFLAVVLGAFVFGCFAVFLLVRLIERPLFGMHRPITPYITQFVCRVALRGLGLRLHTIGQPMKGEGAIVANHSSWLDIFVLNACDRVYFVSKDEVKGWPGIGWIARGTGTVFIARDRRAAKAQQNVFASRLKARHRLLFFPEGTSTDGRRVLSFKSTLFGAFFEGGLKERCSIQPVSITYHAPEGLDPRFYAWWGDMGFGPHLLRLLATPKTGDVTVVFHKPVRVSTAGDRKVLSAVCEAVIRRGVEGRLH